jgi:hypothetical protein
MLERTRALWKHPDGAVEMYSEVFLNRAVPRMVEVFADGRAEADTLAWRASREPLSQGTSQVDSDMPTIAELRATTAAKSPGTFECFECTQLEFETVFRNARPLTEPKDDDA